MALIKREKWTGLGRKDAACEAAVPDMGTAKRPTPAN